MYDSYKENEPVEEGKKPKCPFLIALLLVQARTRARQHLRADEVLLTGATPPSTQVFLNLCSSKQHITKPSSPSHPSSSPAQVVI